MKKYFGLGLLSLAMLMFLVACGGSMEDKEIKGKKYYKENIEEAQDKVKWCLSKVNSDEKELEKAINEVINAGGIHLVYGDTSYNDLNSKMKTSGLKAVDASNCIYALDVYLENEFEKVKK